MELNDLKLDEEVLRILTIRLIGLERDNLLSNANDKKSDVEMVKLIKKNIQEKVQWKLNQ